ncbi:aldo/keto reductase [Brevibacterium samyangense]
MQTRRVGSSGLEVADIGLGALEWGTRVSAEEAATMLGVYTGSGGSLLELPPAHLPAADVLGELSVPAGLTVCARVGGHAGLGRAALLGQTRDLLTRTGREAIDLLVLDGFDPVTPLEETASALDTLLTRGDVVHVAVAGANAWQLACAAGAGLPVTAVLTEWSLLARGSEDLVEAAEYLGIGVIAGAALGHGVLTGKYASRTPADSRAANDAGRGTSALEDYLGPVARSVVNGVVKAATGLGVTPLDVALAWNRSLPVASSLVAPRTSTQLEEILRSALVLEPEIREALDQISEPLRLAMR